MKPSKREIEDLRQRITSRYETDGRSYAEIGRLAGVHASQVGRICSGQFRTISTNLVQICRVLGVEVETVTLRSGQGDASWGQLEVSLRNLWDETPAGARRIAKILDTMAEWRAG